MFSAQTHPGGVQAISRGYHPRKSHPKIDCTPAGGAGIFALPTGPAMSSTHLSLHVHVVFGTKGRCPLIGSDWQARLHAVLGGAARHLDATPEAIGGMADHVHLLVGFKATHRLADIVRDLKRSSSLWVHETIHLPEFAWQDGYGAFSVSASDRKRSVLASITRPNPIAPARSGKNTSPSCAARAWNTTSIISTDIRASRTPAGVRFGRRRVPGVGNPRLMSCTPAG